MRTYLLQTYEMQFDAHNHAFSVFERIPGRASTTRTAIDKAAVATRRQRPLPGESQPLPVRPGVLQSCVRLGEGTVSASSVLSTCFALSIAGSPE